MLNIENYYILNELRIDRIDTAQGRGGGLIVFIKNDLNVYPVECNNVFNQYCKFRVMHNDKCRLPLFITFIYRSPNSSVENTLELAKLIEKSERNCLIIGDFNLPNLSLENGTSDARGKPILEATSTRFLQSLIDFPTHLRGNTLDLALADIDAVNSIYNVENIGNLGNSDHALIKIELHMTPAFNASSELVRNWRRGDEKGLSDHLKSVDFIGQFQGKNVENVWCTFRSILEDSIDRYIPLAPRRKQGSPPWMTREVKRLANRKQKAWKCFSKNRSAENLEKYKLALKACKKGVSAAKRSFERKLASSGNKRPFCAYIKSKCKSKERVGPLVVDGRPVTESKKIAGVLNSFFTSVFTKEPPGPLPAPSYLNCDAINNIVISESQVRKKLLALRPGSAPGPDGISPRFLSTYAEVLATPLTYLFNKSLREGSVPLDWKKANVTPIFKKGSRGDPGNYRPVSLTSSPGRVMEACLRDEIVDHLIRNSLLHDSQHGFLKNKSCTTNLLEFLERMTSLQDEGKSVDVIYLDFSKAFDKVPHRRLLAKMEAHGIGGHLLAWVQDWLSDRSQRTVLNGEFSTWNEVSSGVPQGSVLGPLAFTIYINDLDETTRPLTIMNKFADDTKCANAILDQSDVDMLQACLDDLVGWADTWGMAFNVSKCKVMHLGRNNQKAEYRMSGQALLSSDSERDIGVQVQSSLKPSLQCAEAARRAMAVLSQITRAFHYRDKKVFPQLYKQYVRPHLEFAVPAWSPWTAADKQVLERVQERAIRMVSGLRPGSYEDKLCELGMLTLESRRLQYDLVQTFKIIRGFDRVNPSVWFKLVGANPTRLTRGTHDPLNIVPQPFRGEIRRNFFSNRVVSYWNAIPSETKRLKSVAAFKNYAETMLLDKQKLNLSRP